MASEIYPPELQFNKANRFLDSHLSIIAKGFDSSKIEDERDDYDFDIDPFLSSDVPRRASYGVNISQLIWFARVCNQCIGLLRVK